MRTAGLAHCPICNFHKFTADEDTQRGVFFINCQRCGEFSITEEFIIFQDVKEKISKISYILSGLAREIKETGGDAPLFKTDNLEEYTRHYLVPDGNSIEGKIKKFLQRLKEKTNYFGEEIELGELETLVSLAYAKNSAELMALFQLISESKLAKVSVTINGDNRIVKISLLANGWNFTNSFEKANKESELGFVAIWFDGSMNESIDAIEQAIQESGFKPICIRDEHFSERIMDKALGEIRKSRFVIVDLTGNRGSVFFEAGFAHGLGIETIYVYREQSREEKLPLEFYVRHYQCYRYKDYVELKEILKNAISARIQAKK